MPVQNGRLLEMRLASLPEVALLGALVAVPLGMGNKQDAVFWTQPIRASLCHLPTDKERRSLPAQRQKCPGGGVASRLAVWCGMGGWAWFLED